MTTSTLEQLRNEFLQEAQSAPKLFRDLAKLEQYIAESYKTRALIELMQNADDASSTVFGLHSIESGFIVGNNGRAFTSDDVEALCRSGSSNKHRGGDTIGYRGIGFKSVVNLANRIFVFSGSFAFCFDKGTTKRVLQSNIDVPLIRVPHSIEGIASSLQKQALKLMSTYHYQTVFVFQDLNERISLEDLSGFDRSSLLFLNNLRTVHIDFQNIRRHIRVDHRTQGQRTTVKIMEEKNVDEWDVEYSKSSPIDRVALKKQNDIIVPALPQESVVHSFTPTHEFVGAHIKINGDYTTDPSRKNIDLDELSQKSMGEAVSLIADSISRIMNGDLSRKGFFSPFVNVQPQESSRFSSLLCKSIESALVQTKVKTKQGTLERFASIKLKPEWLNYEDYESLCHDGIVSISKELLVSYPDIFTFLDIMHIKALSLDEILQRINTTNVTVLGSGQIFTKIVKQYRYDLDNVRIERLIGLRIFPLNGGFVQANQVESSTQLLDEFRSYVNTNADPADVSMFFKKLGIEVIRSSDIVPITLEHTSQVQPVEKNHDQLQTSFKAQPAIKKWRSAEQNAAEYLKSLKVVLNVADVTQANLGYDLEVLLVDGRRVYVEIKSVSSFSEPFKITNNEYSSAHNYGTNYFIALVINNEPFLIQFVPDPINTLAFEKKCERWSWYCEQYTAALQDVHQVL